MYQCFTKVCRLILIFCFTSEFLLGLFSIQFYSHQESNILHRLIICCIKLNQKLFFFDMYTANNAEALYFYIIL